MSKKTDLITGVARSVTLLSDAYNNLLFLKSVYQDEAFTVSGADEIVQSDIDSAGYDFTPGELKACVDTLTEQLNLFMNNQAITPADNQKRINLVLKLLG